MYQHLYVGKGNDVILDTYMPRFQPLRRKTKDVILKTKEVILKNTQKYSANIMPNYLIRHSTDGVT